MRELIQLMRRDPKYKTLKTSFDTVPLYRLAVDDMITEIERMNRVRIIRRLSPAAPDFIDKIVQANCEDQANRGRLTEIKMTCVRATANLKRAVDALHQYLLTQFSDDLRKYRTREERREVVNQVLTPFNRYLDEVDVLRETADLVIADIDKGNFSLKLSVSVLQIDRRSERTV